MNKVTTTKIRVSVITRTKDRPALVRRAIVSVLEQTLDEWEHIIVNDGGDAASLESVAALFQDRYQGRLQIIHHPASLGMQNASNAGIARATGEFLVIHDDDDSWAPDFLRRTVSCLDRHGPEAQVQGVVTQSTQIFEEIDADGQPRELRRRPYYPFDSITLFKLAAGNLFPPICFLFRRAAWEKTGPFDQAFDALGDWDFNLRFSRLFEIEVLACTLANYHWRHQSLGNQYANTVTDAVHDQHIKMTDYLRNAYLRRDLDQGKNDLGWLLNVAPLLNVTPAIRDNVSVQLEENRRTRHLVELLHDSSVHLQGYLYQITADLARVWRLKTWLLDRRKHWFGKKNQTAARTLSFPQNREVENPHATLRALSERVEHLSFDVFDTLISRPLRQPADLFWIMQPHVRTLLGRPGLDFKTIRVNAEALARGRRRMEHKHDEVSLEDIYCCLRELLDCTDSQTEEIKALELQTEQKVLLPMPGLISWIREQQKKGRPVTLISDMYVSAAWLSQLLATKGIEASELFVSSEIKCSKYEGKLFDYWLNGSEVKPNRVAHVGDNPVSDIEQPRRRGMHTLHWQLPAAEKTFVDQVEALTGGWNNDLLSSHYTGLVRRRRWMAMAEELEDDSLWSRLGYEMAGPLYVSFVYWILRKASQTGCRTLYFLARDGFPLHQTACKIAAALGLNINCVYTYASRRLLNLPAITCLDAEAMEFLCCPNPAMTARDFFLRVGLEPPDDATFNALGIHRPDQIMTHAGGGFIDESWRWGLGELFRRREEEILGLARAEFKQLADYFDDINLGNDVFGVVDLGWQASSVRSIRRLLKRMGKRSEFNAYYFATWRYAQPALDEGCTLTSFYCHLHKPQLRADLLAESVELIEMFFADTMPSIVSLNKNGEDWLPICGSPELSPHHQAAMDTARKAAMTFVDDMLPWLPDPRDHQGASGLGYLDAILARVLRNPKPSEADTLGDLSLRNSFGGQGPLRHLAKTLDQQGQPLSGQALREAYDNCYWKKGFAVRLTNEQRAELGAPL